jgi:hypothetical protein
MTSRLIPAVALALLNVVAGCATLGTAPPDRDASLRLAAGIAAYDDARYAEAFHEFAWVARNCPAQEAGVQARAALASLELDPRNRLGRPGVGTQLLADLILDPRTPAWLRPAVETTYLLSIGLGAPPGRGPHTPTADLPGEWTEPGERTDPAEPDERTEPDLPSERTEPDERNEPGDRTKPGERTEPGDRTKPGERTEPDLPGERTEPGESAAAAADDGPSRVAAAPAVVHEDNAVRGCGRILAETGPAPAMLPMLPGPSLRAMLGEAEAARDVLEERVAAMETELSRLRVALAEARSELERIRRTLRP